MFIEYLLCIMHCSKSYEYGSEQEKNLSSQSIQSSGDKQY